jgi:hypothetical protein
MDKFNLLKEIIIVEKQPLLNAISSQKYFGICLNGEITFDPDNKIVIYKGKHTPKISALTPKKPISIKDFLGPNYRVAEDQTKVGIKASTAWQDIIGFNYDNALYDDTTAEGVHEFSDDSLEQIGWYADEFGIDYRELIDIIEANCKGTLLCVEQEEPYNFSGLGFVDDPKEAYDLLYNHCQEKIKNKIATDTLYKKDQLNNSELEAAKFFDAI